MRRLYPHVDINRRFRPGFVISLFAISVFLLMQGYWLAGTSSRPDVSNLLVFDEEKLIADDGMTGDVFGTSVSISGDTAVVGAPGNDGVRGSAYVFERSGNMWMQTAKLTASDSFPGDVFGNAVAISGDIVVIGAMFRDEVAPDSGSAYLFEKPPGGWMAMTETAKLVPSNGGPGHQFGNSVAVSGDNVVVGASSYAEAGDFFRRGAAYVFAKPPGGWTTMTETARLAPLSPGPGDQRFGHSVSINGDTIVAGSPFDDGNESDSGAAYLFVKQPGGWTSTTETAKLTASNGAGPIDFSEPGDKFGSAVSVSGNVVVVGAPSTDRFVSNGPGGKRSLPDGDGFEVFDVGTVYIFEKPTDGWVTMTETARLGDDFQDSVEFGNFVAIDQHTLLASLGGTAYLFEMPPGGWSDTTESAVLVPSDGAGVFGLNVAISGGRPMVGAVHGNGNAVDSGSAYVFEPASLACSIGITCPGPVTAASTVTGGPSAIVNYPAPTVTSDCADPAPMVTCVPPSGSIFPRGTSTITCAATHPNSLDVAECSFTLTVFDVCLQDGSTPNVLLFNSATGDFRFCCQTVGLVSGTGAILRKGNTITLNARGGSYRLDASVGPNRGTATLKVGATRCTILDRNTTNLPCSCSAP